MDAEPLLFNGVDGASGEYLSPPLRPQDVAAMAQGESLDPAHVEELRRWWQSLRDDHLALMEGLDPTDLSASGWGVIFAEGADPAVREALLPLLDHRRAQAARRHEHYYQEYAGASAYRAGQSKQSFLAGRRADPGGPADPERVPYYLLIVGDPEAIPFRFQYQLDVQYAVGRLHFEAVEDYARYAQGVVDAETRSSDRERTATFFGVRNAGDRPTQLSADHLVAPLAESVAQDHPDWRVRSVLRDEATKTRLAQVLGGNETPALLFSASHGMGFPRADERQRRHQGALLCQDWPGPLRWRGAIPPRFYFAGEDLEPGARLGGLVALFFACYGAGTPRLDDFAHRRGAERESIADRAFVAELPQRMLAHPNGGALAVVAHVERAWGYSFWWPRAGEQLAAFRSVLLRLLKGHPVGSALEPLNQRYAALSTDLSAELEEIRFGKVPDDLELSGMWTATNDARSYVVIGDPAVRLVRP